MINQGLKMLKRAIDERPKGGMQTGMPKIQLREADALRAVAELEWAQQLISELDATVERFRDSLQNYTAMQVCCGQGEIQYSSEGEPIGQECCGKPDIDWPEDVVELLSATPHQNLNAVKREAFIEGFNAGFTDCWITDEEEHAEAAVEIASQRYPDKDGE